MERADVIIKVETESTLFILRHLCPHVEDVAIYLSVANNTWCISCKCTEEEYWTIKNFFKASDDLN